MEELSKLGFKIDIEHSRMVVPVVPRYVGIIGQRRGDLMRERDWPTYAYRLVSQKNIYGVMKHIRVMTRGGCTVVNLSIPGQRRPPFRGVSNCRVSENFDRRYGLYLSVERAMEMAGMKAGDVGWDVEVVEEVEEVIEVPV